MKILLTAVNAKYIHSNPAVSSLKAYAGAYGSQVETAEYTINHQEDFIIGSIYKKQPDILAFSCYIWNISMIRSLAAELKKLMPDTKIWLGGPEVSYDVREGLLKEAYCDLIMMGEGEETFLELLKYYVDGKRSLGKIKGIAWKRETKEGCEIVVNSLRPPMDLNCLPFLYQKAEWPENKIVYYETSRGCPYCCSYCLSSVDKKVRFRDLGLVKKELRFLVDQGAAQIKFVDRTFNCSRDRAVEIWKFIREIDRGITNFHFEISADILDEQELILLNSLRPGLIQLEIGVQSVNPRTLEAIHRKMDLEKLSYAVEKIRAGKNIHQHLDLIAGLPYEDMESFSQSFNRVYKMKPDQLQLGFLKILKGAAMARESKEWGMLYKSTPPYEVLSTKWMSYPEILKLKQVEEMVEVYYNSGQFLSTMEYLGHFFGSPFSFYLALGEYYEKNKYNEMKHSRISRYDILLLFVRENLPKQENVIKQTLVYDLYLRENVKSRPDFAEEETTFKEFYRKFFHQREEVARLLPGYEGFSSSQIGRMTHIEHFTVDIERLSEAGQFVELENFVLFDYRNQDTVFKRARTVRLEGIR